MKLNNICLWKKFIIFYVLITILPLLLIMSFLTDSIQKYSYESSINLSENTLIQISENISTRMSTYNEILSLIINDSRFQTYISSQYAIGYDAYYEYITYLEPLFRRMTYKNSHSLLRVYSNNATIGISRIFNNNLRDLAASGFVDMSSGRSSDIQWLGIRKPAYINSKKYLGLCRIVWDIETINKVKAVLAVFFSEEEVYSLYSKEADSGKRIFVCDHDGYIISSTERDSVSRSIVEYFNPAGVEHYDPVKYAGGNYVLLRGKIHQIDSGVYGWQIFCLLPIDALSANTQTIRTTSIVLCVMSFIFSALVTVLLTSNINGRLGRLLSGMELIGRGELKTKIAVTGNDEIGNLEKNVAAMVYRIDSLMKDIYVANLKIKDVQLKNQIIKTKQKEAEILALRGQINPHYLFNTLESIRMKLLLKGDHETAGIIKIFGNTFRACISENDNIHSLADEMAIVDGYIAVQKYRHGSKLMFIKDLELSLTSCYIPKLCIQPLVENAIQHGLERKAGVCNITISTKIGKNTVRIIVADDGIGMEKDAFHKLKQSIYFDKPFASTCDTSGVALKNIHHRIRLIFGGDYGLHLSSAEGKGMTVELILPMLPERGISHNVEGFDCR